MTGRGQSKKVVRNEVIIIFFKQRLRSIFFLIVLQLLFPSFVLADDSMQEDLFKHYADDAVSFFAPLSGQVKVIEGDRIEIGIGSSEGVRNGMRLKVFRKGEEFRHPVTGEVLGKVESEVGSIEVTETAENVSTAHKMAGDIRVDDMVRISKGTIPVLFYQTKSVDWAVGDALYRKFKDSGRFEIIETEFDKDDMEIVLGETMKTEAIFTVLVRQKIREGKEIMEVSLYHPDGARFYKDTTELTDDMLKELKFGYSFLMDTDTSFQLSFEVPPSTEFISSCDVDGDGNDEFVMAIDTEIEVFKFGVSLKLLYYANLGRFNEVISLDCHDIDDDSKSEIVVTSVVEHRIDDEADESQSGREVPSVSEGGAISEVLTLSDGKLVSAFKKTGFMRIIDGLLYFQAFSGSDGYSGNVYQMKYEEGLRKGESLKLPSGTNIYDFMPVQVGESQGHIVIDDSARINLFDANGLRIWRSHYKLGGFLREYEIPGPSIMSEPVKWYVKDRIIPHNGRFIMIRREPVADSVSGLGFSSADIIALIVKGILIEDKSILKDIGGTMMDFEIMDDKIVVLVKPFMGINMGKIFKGENPFKRNLYVFSLKE